MKRKQKERIRFLVLRGKGGKVRIKRKGRVREGTTEGGGRVYTKRGKERGRVREGTTEGGGRVYTKRGKERGRVREGTTDSGGRVYTNRGKERGRVRESATKGSLGKRRRERGGEALEKAQWSVSGK